MLNDKQNTVFKWLMKKELSIFAELYKGAVFLLKNKTSGYVSFVSHAGRELMNGLPSELGGIQRSQVQYSQLSDKILEKWESHFKPLELPLKDKEHSVPYEVLLPIKKLLKQHHAGRLRAENKSDLFFSELLDYSFKDEIPENFLRPWREAKKFFNSNVHAHKGRLNPDSSDYVENHFRQLDDLLYVVASRESERFGEIDEILRKTNG